MGQKKSTPSMLNPGEIIFLVIGLGFSTIITVRIYVGDDMLIHLMAAGMKKSSSSLCPKCGYNRDRDNGIVKTCLACFLDGNNLHIFEYGMPCKSPDEVSPRKRFWQDSASSSDAQNWTCVDPDPSSRFGDKELG
ncbi:hypothetical protein Patl1_23236 [Pistacia atlantica]|uniref:Uncharacterized protein n=1 Tax=Pistacia atlantica TaxID=434234 RepID=A0ACC1A036_9ROSI|nr:hypothetical protein Patl1_23236 [Pistacia atlantica]